MLLPKKLRKTQDPQIKSLIQFLKHQVTTFEDTQIEVMGLATPGAKPVILESLERIVIEEGSLPSKVEKITPFEAEKMKKELTGIPRNTSAA